MGWKTLTKAAALADFLGVLPSTLSAARRQRSYVYIKETRVIKKKRRQLCYPSRDSELKYVQTQLKERCLKGLPVSDAVRGYREGQHNINVSELIAGHRFVGTLDIKDFHPSITPDLVVRALRRLGVSHQMSRIVKQLVTYDGQVPQGAPTSNHIANLVVDMILADRVLSYCAARSVRVINFGDDTAFGGEIQAVVDECAQFAKDVFAEYGLTVNSKSTCAEHMGAARKFIGTSTGRSDPDLTRKKYREYRAEVRAALSIEKDPSVNPRVSETEMRSYASKISYVKRLNKKKARSLKEVFFRLAQLRNEKFASRNLPCSTAASNTANPKA
jgi:hypothetical protein